MVLLNIRVPPQYFYMFKKYTMRKILILIAIAFLSWLGCKKTDTVTPIVKSCVRVYDTVYTVDSYTEMDSFSTYLGIKTMDFKLRLVSIKSQTGTCDAQPTCSNLLSITNLTNKTVTIFYNLVGGSNVMMPPNSKKDEVVPVGVFATPNGACFSLADLKKSIKVRY
jgi:hypothetical protein